MSTRPHIPPYKVISNGDMSGNLTGSVTVVPMPSVLTYVYVFTGAPVGSIKIQVSNDYSLDATGKVLNPGTWTDLLMAVNGSQSTTIAVSGAGNGVAEIGPTAAYAVRTTYTFVSGTGTLNCNVSAKVT